MHYKSNSTVEHVSSTQNDILMDECLSMKHKQMEQIFNKVTITIININLRKIHNLTVAFVKKFLEK